MFQDQESEFNLQPHQDREQRTAEKFHAPQPSNMHLLPRDNYQLKSAQNIHNKGKMERENKSEQKTLKFTNIVFSNEDMSGGKSTQQAKAMQQKKISAQNYKTMYFKKSTSNTMS